MPVSNFLKRREEKRREEKRREEKRREEKRREEKRREGYAYAFSQFKPNMFSYFSRSAIYKHIIVRMKYDLNMQWTMYHEASVWSPPVLSFR